MQVDLLVCVAVLVSLLEILEGTQEPSVQVPKLLINEVNPDNPGGGEDAEYIKLFYTGRTRSDLQGYWLVLYNGNSQAYWVLDLSGLHTDKLGYFLVGSSTTSPAPMIRLPPSTMQNGGDTVALYYSNTTLYKVNMAMTAEGLVDAMVYTSRMPEKAAQLLAVLVPGQSILYENSSHSTKDESLSRCHSLSSFQVTMMMPLQENLCSSSSVLDPPAVRIKLNLMCMGSLVKVWGQAWARPPEQQCCIEAWCQGFLASPHPFTVDSSVLKTSPKCVALKVTPSASHSAASFQDWEIALFLVGSLLLMFLLVGLAFYFIKRHPQNYTNIEMSDCGEMAAEF